MTGKALTDPFRGRPLNLKRRGPSSMGTSARKSDFGPVKISEVKMSKRLNLLVLLVLICIICSAIRLLSPGRPSSEPEPEPTLGSMSTSTPDPVQKLGDRVQLAQHFEHVYDITWKHVISNDRDRAVGNSPDGLIALELNNDPVLSATLAVVRGQDDKAAAQAIVDFLNQLLDGDEYNGAVKMLASGGEKTIGDVYVKIYTDTTINKAIFKVIWVGGK